MSLNAGLIYNYRHISQHGVGLIEILITCAVMSVGLLSIATMQQFSLRACQDAYAHTQANVVALSLHECLNTGHHLDLRQNQVQLISQCQQIDSISSLNQASVELIEDDGTISTRLDWLNSLGHQQSLKITSIVCNK